MLRYLTTAVLLFFAVTASQAQPGGGGPIPGDPPTGAPIDGGASILLASGVAYTIRKVQQRRRKTA